MIVATTQDLAEIGNCDCPCEMAPHPCPRRECVSIAADLCGVTPQSAPVHPSSQDGVDAEEDAILYPSFTWELTGSLDDSTATASSSETGTWTAHPIARLPALTCGKTIDLLASYTDEHFYDSGTKAHKSIRETATWTVSPSDPTFTVHNSGHVTEYNYAGTITSDGPFTSTFAFDGPHFGGIHDSSWVITGTTAVLSFTPDEVVIVGGGATSAVFSFSPAYTAETASAALAADFTAIATWPGTESASSLTVTPAADNIRLLAASAIQSKFRLAPPDEFSTTEHPRSYYEAQWDIGFFPDGWDAMIDDPAVTPPDPLPDGWEHPQIPDPAAPPPVYVSSGSWLWSGDTEDPWSERFTIPLPEAAGQNRVLNMMVKSWRSTRLGCKPTACGEQYVFPE